MFTIPSNDTIIGVVLGPDIGNDSIGSATRWLSSFQTWAGWTGKPMLGHYLYPNYNNSQWVLKVTQGAGPMCWGSQLVPNDVCTSWVNPKKPTGTEIAALMTLVRAGKLDARWTALATLMVSLGHTSGIYRTGFEGNGNNFYGSAGQIGDANYAEIMQRHLGCMLAVSGWNFRPEWNYSVYNAVANGLNPDNAWCRAGIGVVGMDLYDVGGYTYQGWTAVDHDQVWTKDILPQLTAQQAFADKHGLRLGFTEFGPLWKADGHGGGDSRYFLDHFCDWIMQNNPSHAFLFNGSNLPGDEARVAAPSSSTSFAFVDNTRMQRSAAPGVKQLFDPVKFLNKPLAPITYTQAQLDAAVKAGTDPLNVRLVAVQGQNAALTSQITGLTAQVSTLTTQVSQQLAASTARLASLQDQLSAATAMVNAQATQIAAVKAQIAQLAALLAN